MKKRGRKRKDVALESARVSVMNEEETLGFERALAEWLQFNVRQQVETQIGQQVPARGHFLGQVEGQA